MFKNARGFAQMALASDPLTRRGIELWLERVYGAYGEPSAKDGTEGGVDVAVIAGQILLTAETEAYLYDAAHEPPFTRPDIPYRAGSRPLLEAAVEEALPKGDLGDRDKALALMRRCRDNRDRGLRGGAFTGGSEEELLKRGAIMCNEIHRVFVCLCQIAGLRARLMCAHVSGHMMAEVEVDGLWWWIDCMQGCYCFTDDGEPASARDLVRDPSLCARQSDAVYADLRPTKHFAEGLSPWTDAFNRALRVALNRDCIFHPREAVALGNYYAWESGRYDCPWYPAPADPVRLARARHAEAQNRRAAGWPEHYFNPLLFAFDGSQPGSLLPKGG